MRSILYNGKPSRFLELEKWVTWGAGCQQQLRFQWFWCSLRRWLNRQRRSIVPRSLEGSDDIGNLALACRRCNERRYNFVAGIDPETKQIVPIFNPLNQRWAEHFIWLDGNYCA